jgi:hypothetical protein
VLTQNDIESEGRFDDLVAYGGWTMDDHHPAGFHAVRLGAPATIFHPAPSPYGIPYRSFFSPTLSNLMFAGRCHSATHSALSSTRVMGTCCAMGQAVGTAAALAVARSISPADVLDHIDEVQQALLEDDCYLPWVPQRMPAPTAEAEISASQGNPEPVRDGVSRPVGEDSHAWECRAGDWVAYAFSGYDRVSDVIVVFDSALERDIALTLHHRVDTGLRTPEVVPRSFRLEGLADGRWTTLRSVEDNHQRFVRLPVNRDLRGLRLTLEQMWGGEATRVYAFYAR